jgi:hypothetical protein
MQDRTIVVHCKRDKFDVYIGRGSKWGNPFTIGIDGTRDEVIELYKKYIITQDHLMGSLHELSGKRLGCFCYPRKCHGDILVQLIEKQLN